MPRLGAGCPCLCRVTTCQKGEATGRMRKIHQPPYYDPAKAPVFRYFRMSETYPHIRWWRPLLVGVLTIVYFLLFSSLIITPVILLSEHFAPSLFDPARREGAPLLASPVSLFFTVLVTIALIPACLLAMNVSGRPLGTLYSVEGRFRWRLFGRSFLLAVLITVPITSLLMIFDPVAHDHFRWPDHNGFILIVITLLLVPMQAAGEELVFRGILGQMIGSWLAHPVWPILLPLPLLIVGQNYGIVSQVDIAIFALGAGFVTWATGGLEAAIALHIVGNVVFYSLAAFNLLLPNSLDSGSMVQLLVSTLIVVIYSTLVVTHHDAVKYPNHARAQPGALEGRVISPGGM